MLEYRYDTQLLIEGEDLDEDEIFDYIASHFKRSMILLWKIWTASPGASTADKRTDHRSPRRGKRKDSFSRVFFGGACKIPHGGIL